MSQRLLVLQKILNFFSYYYSYSYSSSSSRQNLVRTSPPSFNDTDLSLGTHLHIGLKLCILTGNSEILIKSDLLTSIKILTSFS